MENNQFALIYRENAALIYRYLLSIGCLQQEAEDIIQETFVKALLTIDSFRGECKLSVWLCQIAKNTWYDYLKKQKREINNQQEDILYIDEINYFEIIDVIWSINEPYKSVFIKKCIEGWTYTDIANKYGKTENWARVTFFRAKLQIQKLLKPYIKEE